VTSKNTTPPANADLNNRLLDEKEAAMYLGFSPRSLQNWRVRGEGPRFIKVSARSVRYRMPDLLAWIEKRTRQSTSDWGIFS
jgi:predicted DNA-binding transcriptional regulator AlpA